ncbi:hypothetical protein TrVE_jg5252 [Triparma verrucosa]|uniref:Uncharacterized protein n=1 Tax=Triparma verrucosa TaxID=1606542 RepID=A0A9W7B5X5_9STRA|nr:hypothetical protein TrVE_jg5252 [Triparma verrucosa]
MGGSCSGPVDQTSGSMRRIEKNLNASAEELAKLSFRDESNKRITPIINNGKVAKGGKGASGGRGGGQSDFSVTLLKGLLDDELADVDVAPKLPKTVDADAPRPQSLRVEPSKNSPTFGPRNSFKKARTMTVVGAENVKQGIISMASKATGVVKDGDSTSPPARGGGIVRGMSQRLAKAPEFLFEKRGDLNPNARIEKQLGSESPTGGQGGRPNGGTIFARNRWGALKSNLTDVMVAEQRRTYRGGKMVVVEESGIERPANSAEMKLGPSSPGQQEVTSNDLASHHRTKKKLSFSESRFTRAVSQRKKNGGAAAVAAAARHRQMSRLKRGNSFNGNAKPRTTMLDGP